MVDVYINTKENDFRYNFFISTKQGRIQEFVRGEGSAVSTRWGMKTPWNQYDFTGPGGGA